MSEETKDKINGLLTQSKTRSLLIFICIALLAVLFFYSSCGKEESEEINTVSTTDTENYRKALTDEILDMVKSVNGTGDAKILLTLDTSYEYIYLDDDETLKKVNEPKIRGVVVTCKGGDSAKVRQEVTELLTTALGIPSTKVCVKKLS